jgi:hypothetical protein
MESPCVNPLNVIARENIPVVVIAYRNRAWPRPAVTPGGKSTSPVGLWPFTCVTPCHASYGTSLALRAVTDVKSSHALTID